MSDYMPLGVDFEDLGGGNIFFTYGGFCMLVQVLRRCFSYGDAG